jgi:dCMP deaminase
MSIPVRPTLDHYLMSLAYQVSSRATCQEAQVGAVLVNSDNHILATGYNGSLPGQPECSGKSTCKLIRQRANGERLQMCPTIHSEANCLAQFRLAHNQPHVPPGSTIYVTTFPCLSCLQLLIQAKVSCIKYASVNSWHQLGYFYNDRIQLEFYPLARHQANLLANHETAE